MGVQVLSLNYRISPTLPEIMAPREDHSALTLASSAASVDADALETTALLRRLLRAKDHMDAASHEAWPVQRLAKVSGVSEAHFARSFKRAFGLPPHRYLLSRRIEQATTLLRDTELSITDIAFATGWESLGTFGRTFHDITGRSPSAMRLETRANLPQLDCVPACVLKAAQRPDLTIAVSEKRRRAGKDTLLPTTKEVS
jgi:AraC-like DNA-binding protein